MVTSFDAHDHDHDHEPARCASCASRLKRTSQGTPGPSRWTVPGGRCALVGRRVANMSLRLRYAKHVIATEVCAKVLLEFAKARVVPLRAEGRHFLAGVRRHGCGRTRGCRRSGRCRTRGPCSATTGRAAVRVCPAVATGSLLFELESDHWSICRPYTTRESDSCSSGCPLVSESGGGEAYWAWLVLCACRVSTCGGSSSALAAPESTSSSGRCTVPMLAHWCP